MVHNFNSIKVQLEHRWACSAKLLQMLFQFHKGTIRTMYGNVHVTHDILFQFHKGTIRTPILRRTERLRSNFNSIKVQLELPDHYCLVRQLFQFQFHKGTIRTR